MSRGNRSIVGKTGLTLLAIATAIAFGLWVIASGLSRDADYQRQADDHSREYAAYTKQQVRKDCFPLTGVDQVNCTTEKRYEYRKDRREERDLVAQRKSANWAYIMGAAAVLGMVLSAVGVVLVWTTFRETRRSADAAHDSNRPWVKVTASPERGFSMGSEGMTYDVEVHMTNIGNSPALDVSYLSTFLFFDPTIEQLHELTPNWFDGDGYEWRDKIIFQGDTWERKSGAVHSGDPPGRTRVNLIVAVRYRTPFDRVWRYTVRVYALHSEARGDEGLLDLSNLADARNFRIGFFDAHQRIAGIAT